MGLLGSGLTVIITFYLWKAIFESSGQETIRGFTFNEMIIYIFISLITMRLTNNYVEYMVSDDVRSGALAMNLIKPINYFIRLLFTSIGNIIGESILINGPMIIGVVIYQIFYSSGTIPSLSTLLLYIVSILLSFMIMMFFNFCFGMLSFYVVYLWGLNFTKTALMKFLSGELIPLAFFPLGFRKIMHLTPFASINYTPVMIYLNKYTGYKIISEMGVQVIWVILLMLLSYFIWKRAIKRVTIMGG